ncbi:MAG: rRNA maturation RNase YbeY [Bacillota bacterium]
MSTTVTVLIEGFYFSEGFKCSLAETVDHVLKEYDLSGGEVSLVLTGDQDLHNLNKEFRGIDAPTDVLSFCYLDPGEEYPEAGVEFPVGDVYISLERALEQAKQAGDTLEQELLWLVIHGVLHLLGYDHDTEENGGEMRSREQAIINKFVHILPGED